MAVLRPLLRKDAEYKISAASRTRFSKTMLRRRFPGEGESPSLHHAFPPFAGVNGRGGPGMPPVRWRRTADVGPKTRKVTRCFIAERSLNIDGGSMMCSTRPGTDRSATMT